MKIINEQGALTGYAVVVLLILGPLLIYGSLEWIENYYIRVLGYSIGMSALAGAGYGGRASALGLLAFGDAPWRSAKASYNDESRDQSV